jgi:hypothetical protein
MATEKNANEITLKLKLSEAGPGDEHRITVRGPAAGLVAHLVQAALFKMADLNAGIVSEDEKR